MLINELLESKQRTKDFKVDIYWIEDSRPRALTDKHIQLIKKACEIAAKASGEVFVLKKAELVKDGLSLVITAPADTDPMGIEDVIYDLQVNRKIPKGFDISAT